MLIKRLESYFWPLLLFIVALAAWHWSVRWTQTRIFPSPVNVQLAVAELVHNGLLWKYTGDSLLRVSAGYVLALACAIPLGLFLGYYRVCRNMVNPVIQILRPISPLAWIPLAIVWFGIGNVAAVFLIFLASFFPVLISTMNGAGNIPEMLLRVGHNFGLPPITLLRRVIFPAALPQILIGMRISLGVAWLVVVAAEMIAIDSGLGYLIIDSRNAGKRYDLVIAGMLLIGVIGLGLDTGMRRLEKLKFVRWGVSQ